MNRRRLLFAFLLLLLVNVYALYQLPAWTARLVRSQLASLFQREVSVAAVHYQLLPLQLTIEGLRIESTRPGHAPALFVRELTVVPALRSLLDKRLVLETIRVSGLRLQINAWPEGGDDILRTRGRRRGGGSGFELRVGRVVIEQSEFVLDHRRVPLELDLPRFFGRLERRLDGALAGQLAFGPGSLRFGTAPVFPLATELSAVLAGGRLQVTSGALRAEATELAVTGGLAFAPNVHGEFQLSGPISLDLLERHVMRTGLGIGGAARFAGRLGVDGSRLRLRGRFDDGRAGRFDGVPIERFSGAVSWDEHGVLVSGLDVTALGGTARLEVAVPPAPTPSRLEGTVTGGDAEGLVRMIFDIGEIGLGAGATGRFAIQWPRGGFRDLSGTIGVDLTPRADGRRPLSGRFDWSAQDGAQHIERAELRTPATRVRLAGSIARDETTDLAVAGETADVAEADRIFMRLRRALGAAEAQLAGFSGSGLFSGRWRGTLREPIFEGRFTGQDAAWLGVNWGRAEWAGVVDSYSVVSRSLVLRKDGAELWLDGRAETGAYGDADGLDLSVRLDTWPVEDLIAALSFDLDVKGHVSGEARVGGRRSRPQGRARLSSPRGRYYGVPFEALELSSDFAAGLTRGTGSARLGGGAVRFHGTATDDGFYDGAFEVDAVELEELAPRATATAALGGRVSGSGVLQGSLDRPFVRAHFASPRVFFGDEGIGALDATLRGAGDGRINLTASCRSPRVTLALSGELAALAPYPASLRLRATRTSLDPFLRVLRPELPTTVALVADGELELQGPLAEPARLAGSARVATLELLVPEYTIANPEPFTLELGGGQLRVEGLHLVGEGTDLLLEGRAAVLEDGPVRLSLQGAADLRALSALTRRVRGRGDARLAADVSGTRDAPRVVGRLELAGVGLRVRGFPHGLEEVYGHVSFSESAAEFADLRGRLGGGSVTLSGQAAYAAGRLATFDIEAEGRELALRYPEGLRSLIDARLRLYGDAESQWLTGTIDVRQALYTKRYDLASELLATRAALPEARGLGEGVRYDVRVRAPGTLRLDNNLASLVARADLRLQGSYAAPVVLGRAEIERGRVYFQGSTYVIRRGFVDFADPRRIDPRFDIEAETRLRSYRVTLRVAGTLERVQPTLTSDPPLSTVQIVGLLAGADEQAIASVTQIQSDQARLAATGAATLAAGALSEEVGLEREAERLFGLNRFSIDPSVIKGGVTNPTARLTVGKRLTADLNVLYSIDLRSEEDRILAVEYTLSDRISVLMTLEPNEVGFDVRLRRSY